MPKRLTNTRKGCIFTLLINKAGNTAQNNKIMTKLGLIVRKGHGAVEEHYAVFEEMGVIKLISDKGIEIVTDETAIAAVKAGVRYDDDVYPWTYFAKKSGAIEYRLLVHHRETKKAFFDDKGVFTTSRTYWDHHKGMMVVEEKKHFSKSC